MTSESPPILPAVSEASSPYRSMLDSPANLSRQRSSSLHTSPQPTNAATTSAAAVKMETTTSSANDNPAVTSSPTAVAMLEVPTSPTHFLPSSPNSAPSSNGSAAAPQQFCLRWNNYQSNLTSVFDQLLQTEAFVDVTLACDGRSIKAHKVVLSASSPYFQTLFADTPCQHPIVIMRDVNWYDLRAIVEFMYKGEINVSQDQIGPLLRIAEMLKVRGLADVSGTPSLSREAARNRENYADENSSRFSTHSPKRSEEKQETVRSETKSNDEPELIESQSEKSSHDFLTFTQPEVKSRLTQESSWDFPIESSRLVGGIKSSANTLEMRLSPTLMGRNIRKRRWPSSENIFSRPESPLSGLIAAEKAEREREREREREKERERERERERSLTTPPITACSTTSTVPGISSSAPPAVSSSSARLTPSSVLDISAASHLEMPSPSSTPAPMRSHSGTHTPSPHTMHPSLHSLAMRASPASTPHPSIAVSSRVESGSSTDPNRFQLGSAMAAAAAAAAASQMEMGVMGMGGPHHVGHPALHGPASTSSSASSHHGGLSLDDLEIKPGIAEMIREEERVSANNFIFIYI